jgi:hypothetical protein
METGNNRIIFVSIDGLDNPIRIYKPGSDNRIQEDLKLIRAILKITNPYGIIKIGEFDFNIDIETV